LCNDENSPQAKPFAATRHSPTARLQ
jgi:hypothetical protein